MLIFDLFLPLIVCSIYDLSLICVSIASLFAIDKTWWGSHRLVQKGWIWLKCDNLNCATILTWLTSLTFL